LVPRGIFMANKIFVSYKYRDNNVFPISSGNLLLDAFNSKTTVRDYVNKLESYFDKTDYIYKGESDDEDLSDLSDDQIWEKLKARIFDSTVTIVIISPKMKESHRYDKSQWIPWEISYSLRETARNERTSYSNAILAVVLPDFSNSYEYFIYDNVCSGCSCRTLMADTLFNILKYNMFNQKNKSRINCGKGNAVYTGESSYIESIKWMDFVKRPQFYINQSIEIKKNIENYDIVKEV
jgi:hypothetical protein